MAQSLYIHKKHPHIPRNAHEIHQEERASGSVWKRLKEAAAVWLTTHVGTMETAILFTLVAVAGLLGLLGRLDPFIFLLMSWVSQQFIQLVLLPIIMVGQNVLDRAQQLLAEETHRSVEHILSDVEQSKRHLDAQDQKILAIEKQNADQIILIKQMMKTLVDRDDAMTVMLIQILTRLDTPAPVSSSPSFFARFTKQKVGKHG